MEESFLKRWSRLKNSPPAAPDPVPAAAGASPAASPQAPLPAPETLGFSSDFTAYMSAEVDESLRKAALQKLFHGDHFNVMDGLDVYVDDYNVCEPIDAALLQNLNQARGLLFADKPLPETPAAGIAAPLEAAKGDADQVSQPAPANDGAKDEKP